MERFDLVVAGAGPAGITAAIAAAKRGRRVVLLEKAARPGVKILVSGGNRCNLTHDCAAADVAKAFGRAGARFLGPALRELGPRELRAWIESLGVATKVEPGGKVFPTSDRAVDVRDALERELARAGVAFRGGSAVRAIARKDGGFVVHARSAEVAAPRLVLAIGGRSYPKVGTTGDGYAFALALGHDLTPTTPALVPLLVDVPWVRDLSGLTLDDVALTLEVPDPEDPGDRGRTRTHRPEPGDGDSDPRRPDVPGTEDPGGLGRTPTPRAAARREGDVRRGGFLFTHFGLSGPAPMNLGGAVAQLAAEQLAGARLRIDFLPRQERARVAATLVGLATESGGRAVRAFMAELLPRRLGDALLACAGIPPERPFAELSKSDRERLLDALFATRLPIAGTRGFDFAEVTRGGVPLAEVDPKTMASRLVPGLFLCGELLDLDGPIGGYNFTAAFATGALAGRCAAEVVERA